MSLKFQTITLDSPQEFNFRTRYFDLHDLHQPLKLQLIHNASTDFYILRH